MANGYWTNICSATVPDSAMIALFPDYPYLTSKAVKSFLDILGDEGKLKTWHDPEVFLDMSLLREVEKEPGR